MYHHRPGPDPQSGISREGLAVNATQTSPAKRKYTPRAASKFTCGWCSEPFLSSGANAKFCSPSCKDKNRYATSRDSRLAAVQKYRAENALEVRRRARAKYWADQEKAAAQNRGSYMRNRESRIAYAIKYQQENPEVVALTRAMRKAREAFKITRRDHRRLLERYRHSCAYCGIRLAAWGREHANSLQWDHVLPLSRGGRDSVGNLLPVCRKCNGSKSSKLLIAWKQKP